MFKYIYKVNSMKADYIRNEMKVYERAGNKIYGFYVTYKTTENITSQEWGTIDKFEKTLSSIESSTVCIQGELPIERLIIYSGEKYRWQCLVFVKNPLWDCVNDDSENSHVTVVVPYIAIDGEFGKIVSERK